MSEFTRFDAPLYITYDQSASRKLDKDYWRVAKSFRFYLDEDRAVNNEWTDYSFVGRWVFVPAGFLSDGASIPKPFQSFYGPWGNYGQAAVLHDYLCEYLSITVDGKPQPITRKEADDIFKIALLALEVDHKDVEILTTAVLAYRLAARPVGPSNSIMKRRVEAAYNFEDLQS